MSRYIFPMLLALLSLEALSIDSAQASVPFSCDRQMSAIHSAACTYNEYTPPRRGLPSRREGGGTR